MLIEELQRLAADPRSWVVVAFMAVLAIFSIVGLMRCPHLKGLKDPSDDEVRRARETEFRPGLRFGLMMMLGAGLTLAGLFMIAGGIRPTIALGAVVLGIVIIQTEPSRLRIRENKRLVIAARDDALPALDGARDRLRASHWELAATNMVLLFGLVVGLLAF